ncbi:MAG: nucleotidyltransferase domain-containing protein [Nanoarchaeota archaeon]
MKRLNKQTAKAIAYAQDALTFLFLDNEEKGKIKGIYLFGSAVRGELEKESDIDLFIDCKKSDESSIQKAAERAIARFHQSKDYEKWKNFGFEHPISVQVGDLYTWSLKSSILSEGITLYSISPSTLPAERKILITFTLPKNKKKYLQFTRTLFGRKEEGYKDKGMIEVSGGIRIGSNVIIIPSGSQKKIIDKMNNEKIEYSLKEICEFEG